MNRRQLIVASLAAAIVPAAVGTARTNARVGYLELIKVRADRMIR